MTCHGAKEKPTHAANKWDSKCLAPALSQSPQKREVHDERVDVMVGVKLRSPLPGDEEDGKKHKKDEQQI
jgi:hypothetical protein